MTDIKKALDAYKRRCNKYPDKIIVSIDYYYKLADQLKEGEIECFPHMKRFIFGIELAIDYQLQHKFEFEEEKNINLLHDMMPKE